MNTGKLSLLNYLKEDIAYKRFQDRKDIKVSSLETLAILTALSFHERERKMFFLFSNLGEATAFNQFLGDYLSEDELYFFPHDDLFHLSSLGVSFEMKDERMLALSSSLSSSKSIMISHVSACKLNISSKEEYVKRSLVLKRGEMYSMDEIISSFLKAGYISIDHIKQSGQYAKRGMIIDIFDPTKKDPVRIEFFGDEIESIRFFNMEDERSFKEIDEVTIYPSTIRLLNDKSKNILNEYIKDFNVKYKDSIYYSNYQDIISSLENRVEEGYVNERDMRFYSLLKEEDNTLFSFLDDYEKYVYCKEDIYKEEIDISKREKEYFEKSFQEGNSLLKERVYVKNKMELSSFIDVKKEENESFAVRENGYKASSYHESYQIVKRYLDDGYKVRVALSEPSLSNFKKLLDDHQINNTYYPVHSDVLLYDGNISHGFEIAKYKRAYLSSKELYGVTLQKSRFLSRYKEAKIIRNYDEIKVGDYVVHEMHGIGKYLGVVLSNGLEYLKIQYANDALFFLPLAQYKLIRKYSSKDGYTPSLDRLGGSTWARKKRQIRSKIAFIADQLLEIYSCRMNEEGYAFADNRKEEDEFALSFPYVHTDSQRDAILSVRKDMESKIPMDRLIAGDVGFGKTEVAFNAAFKAILSGKQVAFLCPTTILSMQHYKVAKERYKDYPVKICLFNRFVSLSQQKENIKAIKDGKMDLIIGTHRLLSDEIIFNDLGLLIVDEEQKFGVTHKEKIKAKVKNIDCLTLTATPIPRTLESSLLNVKSLSLLKEAPLNRMPVKTYVLKYDFSLIVEVITKELNRKGQVYYLHNEISSINQVASKIKKRFKDNTVAVCHAKMDEDEIEKIMNSFYAGEIDILVCTSIIESGLDIPNVNTIIVERADRFGLSSLYQIKGRVGRSDRLAYAYFFYSGDEKDLTDEARKRLKALTDFTELGSGYKIAMQDLNIRGAGDILGAKQSGFVDSLGYDAYIDLLKEVIDEKTFKKNAEKKEEKYQLSFSLNSVIPSSYCDEKSRIYMYQEIASATSKEELVALGNRIKDIFGNYPVEIDNLLKKREIELFINGFLVSSFVEDLGSYLLVTSKTYSKKENIYKILQDIIKEREKTFRIKIVDNCFAFEVIITKNYLDDLLDIKNIILRSFYQTESK